MSNEPLNNEGVAPNQENRSETRDGSDNRSSDLAKPPKFSWLRCALVYLLKPQTILGGVLAFGISQGADFYKAYRASQDTELNSVRDKLASVIGNIPPTSGDLGKVIESVRGLYPLYDSKAAREKISIILGKLENIRALRKAEEENEAAKHDALRAEAEAKKRQDAKAVEEARLLAQKREAAAIDASKKAVEAAVKVVEAVMQMGP